MKGGKGGKRGGFNGHSQRHDPLNVTYPGGGKKGFKGKKAGIDTEKVALLESALKLVLEKYNRYDKDGLLDCSNLGQIEELKVHKPNLNSDFWCKVISQTAKKLKNVTALSLDGNNIRTLTQLGNLGLNIHSLSLQNNSIDSIQEVAKLKPLGIKHILFAGNPICKAKRETFEKALKRALPTLRRLDDAPLQKSMIEMVDASSSGFDASNATHGFVRDLMDKYFSLANQNSVDKMLDLYETDASMTLTVAPDLRMGISTAGLAFSKKLQTSQPASHRDKHKEGCLKTGKLNVGRQLEMLHSVKQVYNAESIMSNVEINIFPESTLQQMGFQVPALVTVAMHGSVHFSFETKSGDTDVLKYFDRIWLITSKDNVPIIMSDMLTLRNVNSRSPVLKPSGRDLFYSLHMRQQDEKLIQFCQATNGVRIDIGRACLQQEASGPWDLEKGYTNMEQTKAAGKLTQEHFTGESNPEKLRVQLFSEHTGLKPDVSFMCLSAAEASGNLWRAWVLFELKEKDLLPDHFA